MVSETRWDKHFHIHYLWHISATGTPREFEANSRDFKWLTARTSGAEDARAFIDSPLKTANMNPVLNRSMHISHCIPSSGHARESPDSRINGVSCRCSKTSICVFALLAHLVRRIPERVNFRGTSRPLETNSIALASDDGPWLSDGE